MGGGGSGEESVVAVLDENAIGPRPALILFCSWLRILQLAEDWS